MKYVIATATGWFLKWDEDRKLVVSQVLTPRQATQFDTYADAFNKRAACSGAPTQYAILGVTPELPNLIRQLVAIEQQLTLEGERYDEPLRLISEALTLLKEAE